MDKKELFDALDGLYAYDSGCISSGIRDVLLKEKVKAFLLSKVEEEGRKYPTLIDEFLRQSYYQSPYSVEDVIEFVEWLDNLLG